VDTNNVYAVLHYQGAPNAEPTTDAPGGVDNLLEEYQLAALENPGAPGGSAPADRSIDLNFASSVVNGRLEVGPSFPYLGWQSRVYMTHQWTINGIQYESPDLPTLLNIIANNYTQESDFTTPEHTFVLNQNDVIELVIHGSPNGMSGKSYTGSAWLILKRNVLTGHVQ
jgi:iron transport multicopper oxidase